MIWIASIPGQGGKEHCVVCYSADEHRENIVPESVTEILNGAISIEARR